MNDKQVFAEWAERVIQIADMEAMDDSQVIPTWPNGKEGDEAFNDYPQLTVGAVRAILQVSQKEPEQADEWLLQLRGNYLVTRGIWSLPRHCGYTNDIHRAGRYTLSEARRVVMQMPDKYRTVRMPATHPPKAVPDKLMEAIKPFAEAFEYQRLAHTRDDNLGTQKMLDRNQITPSGTTIGDWRRLADAYASLTAAAPQPGEGES